MNDPVFLGNDQPFFKGQKETPGTLPPCLGHVKVCISLTTTPPPPVLPEVSMVFWDMEINRAGTALLRKWLVRLVLGIPTTY